MPVQSLFQNASTRWARYNEYAYREDRDGVVYLAPTARATSVMYDPLEQAETIVVDAINIGILCMNREPDEERIQADILAFAEKYGLFGLMTALPTTTDFMDYDTVYLPKNRFIRDEQMPTDAYTTLFFPFEEDDAYKHKKARRAYVGEDGSLRVSLAARDKPKAVDMCFQRGYAERLEWLKTQFKDWAYSFCSCFFYYEETDPLVQELHRKAISAFDGIAPTYHIELFDRPVIVWDFHSLLLALQMMFSFMLTSEDKRLRQCRHCSNAFIAKNPKSAFCSPQCKNRHNVYKSRIKNQDE